MTSDKCDNFLLFIKIIILTKVMQRHLRIIRVYIEKLVSLSQLSQKGCDREQV